MSNVRVERDSMGEISVPADAKWRAQTQRAVEKFPISGLTLDRSLVAALARIKPKLHVFGHIHEGYGETQFGPTRCLNVSTCNADYQAVNTPIVVDLEVALAA